MLLYGQLTMMDMHISWCVILDGRMCTFKIVSVDIVLDRDIGNIDRPRLIWPGNDGISQQIGTNFGLLHPFRKIHFGIDWINSHFCHVMTGFAAAYSISAAFQLRRHLSAPPGGVIRMQTVYNGFTFQFFLRYRGARIIDAGAVYMQ